MTLTAEIDEPTPRPLYLAHLIQSIQQPSENACKVQRLESTRIILSDCLSESAEYAPSIQHTTSINRRGFHYFRGCHSELPSPIATSVVTS